MGQQNKWIMELPVGTKFVEVQNEFHDYEPSTNVYTKLDEENNILSQDPIYGESDEGMVFPLVFFAETEEFEVVS